MLRAINKSEQITDEMKEIKIGIKLQTECPYKFIIEKNHPNNDYDLDIDFYISVLLIQIAYPFRLANDWADDYLSVYESIPKFIIINNTLKIEPYSLEKLKKMRHILTVLQQYESLIYELIPNVDKLDSLFGYYRQMPINELKLFFSLKNILGKSKTIKEAIDMLGIEINDNIKDQIKQFYAIKHKRNLFKDIKHLITLILESQDLDLLNNKDNYWERLYDKIDSFKNKMNDLILSNLNYLKPLNDSTFFVYRNPRYDLKRGGIRLKIPRAFLTHQLLFISNFYYLIFYRRSDNYLTIEYPKFKVYHKGMMDLFNIPENEVLISKSQENLINRKKDWEYLISENTKDGVKEDLFLPNSIVAIIPMVKIIDYENKNTPIINLSKLIDNKSFHKLFQCSSIIFCKNNDIDLLNLESRKKESIEMFNYLYNF